MGQSRVRLPRFATEMNSDAASYSPDSQPFIQPKRGDRIKHRFLPFTLWAVLAIVFVGCHYHFYFVEPIYEYGDQAANALQVRQAKALHELYGNYSRFGFHHPGPAFFYAYAAGERLLFDLLKITPAPFNAHSIAGVLVQAAFFVWAICIAAKRVRRPLVIPLLLLFGAWHFGTVNHFMPNTAFQSIWPPNVLLMPFLCFVVAAASVASGGTEELVPLALTGSLLVHGHVAQPLFVGPLTLLAYGAWWRRWRECPLSLCAGSIARSHVIAAAIIALFLLPLAIDATKGQQSNVATILRHFTSHSDEHKTLAQSALYLATFGCHVTSPETVCDHLTAASFDFLRTRWPFVLQWALLGVVTLLLSLWNRKRQALAGPAFVRWLAIYFAAAVALTLVWGKLQNGPMFGFNSYFNFAILFLPFMLLAIAIASLPSLRSAVVFSRSLFALSLPLLYFASRNFETSPDFPTRPMGSAELNEQIRVAAQNDRQHSRTKFLLFAHDDWPEATRVALALERLHFKYRVTPEWEVVFGRGRAIDLQQALYRRDIAFWTVTWSGSGPKWIGTELTGIDPRGNAIIFGGTKPNAREFITTGWDISEGPFSWSVSPSAVIRFEARPASGDVEIVCDVAPSSDSQTMTVSFAGGPSETFIVQHQMQAVLRVPAAVWNAHSSALLRFDFPDAQSPLARGISTDPRQLGCAFTRITFTTAGESAVY